MKNYIKILSISLLFAACSSHESKLNQVASVTSADSLLTNPLEQIAITSSIQTNKKTMSTLYGNKTAAIFARSLQEKNYPDKAILYQVTWEQKADSLWYGANLPGSLKSVEVLKFQKNSDTTNNLEYIYYTGSPLRRSENPVNKNERIAYILKQRIALTP